jgi:ubiquinone/menaquinone biosynthesis C-methylase UbiE
MREMNPFETHYEEYDAWFDRNTNVYESELLGVREVLPPPGDWVEIGVGSGRFASRLAIPTGVEPAEGIAILARGRGINVLKGKAECLPLENESVDAAFLITTLCFVDDVDRTFHEVARVLRTGGHAVVAFIPKDSRFGERYCANASEDRFFRHATLPTKRRVFDAIEAAGLEIERIVQTLTGSPERANDRIEPPVEGHERGSFVVVRAIKR